MCLHNYTFSLSPFKGGIVCGMAWFASHARSHLFHSHGSTPLSTWVTPFTLKFRLKKWKRERKSLDSYNGKREREEFNKEERETFIKVRECHYKCILILIITSLVSLFLLFLAHLIEENLHGIPEVEDGFHEWVEMSASHSVTEEETH